MRQVTEASGDAAIAAAVTNLFMRVVATIDAISKLHSEIQASGGGGLPNIGDLPRRLTDFLLLDFFDRQQPELHNILHLLGLIEHEPTPGPGQPVRLMGWNRFGQVFTDPIGIANDVYRWETDFDFDTFVSRLEKTMRSALLPGGIYPQSDAVRAALGNVSSNRPELRLPILQKGFTPETYSQFGITFSPAEAQGSKKRVLRSCLISLAPRCSILVCVSGGELLFESSADLRGVGIVIDRR